MANSESVLVYISNEGLINTVALSRDVLGVMEWEISCLVM